MERLGGANRELSRSRAARVWAEFKRRRGAAEFRRQQRRMAGPRLLREFAEAYPEAFFIEIGSNDGEQHDHLRPLILAHPWSGIMIEPVPYVFARLTGNYGEIERITLVNAAIGEQDGSLPFFHPAEATPAEREGLPSWYDGIGSFSREAVLSHRAQIPDIEERLVERTVPCMTFESLCRRYSVENVDLLLVDTEGYDAEILAQIDLPAVGPRLIVYEHFHLEPEVRAECRGRLAGLGYEILEEGFDTFAFDAAPADRLSAVWRRLRPAVDGVSAHDEQGRS